MSISGTLQVTQAQILSRFGWGMTKQIENHGLARFKANIQKASQNRFVAYLYLMLSTVSRRRGVRSPTFA